MAKAHITMPDGTKLRVEGTPDEITGLVRKLQGSGGAGRSPNAAKEKRRRLRLVDHIEGLVEKGFFRTPRGLSDIRDKLREMGHVYPLTSLSPTMLTQVRRRSLRRMKDAKAGNRWKYAQ